MTNKIIITPEIWIKCFLNDIKEKSKNIGNLYLAEVRTLLQLLPLAKLPVERYDEIVNYITLEIFNNVAERELEKNEKNKQIKMFFSVEMFNKSRGFNDFSESDLIKIREFLQKELQEELNKRGYTLKESIFKRFGKRVGKRYESFMITASEGDVNYVKDKVINSNVNERIALTHENIKMKEIESTIKKHYKARKYTLIHTEANITNDITFYFSHQEEKYSVHLSWGKNSIIITVGDSYF